MNIDVTEIRYRIFKQRAQWRDWLTRHHADRQEIWLGFYKRGVDKVGISNADAVEEALCFGWINGKVRRLDDAIYLQRFSPRHARSVWAQSNKNRVEKLIRNGLMTESGMQLVRQAKQNGSWDAVKVATEPQPLPTDVRVALQSNPLAWEHYRQFTPTQQRDYLWWVDSAKERETRLRRIRELVIRCERNMPPGARDA